MALPKNQEEILALDKFQEVVKDLSVDPGTAMRFLRARSLDVRRAEIMLRTYMDWKVNNIYEPALKGWHPAREFLMQFECHHCGKDVEGRPVYYINLGKWTPSRRVFDSFPPFEVMLFAYNSFLKVYEEIYKSEHQQITAVIDTEGLGCLKIFQEVQYWKGLQTLIDVWTIYESNFPETLHKAFIVNTARTFMWAFNLMKPFVTKQTLAKISIFGCNETDWRPVLHNTLPENCIPPKFGGTSELKHVFDIVYDGIMKRIEIEEQMNS